jgi:predicted transcriptional regulator
MDSLTFVAGSTARREVLSVLASDPSTRSEVLDSAGSSKSSVYDALNKLEEKGFVYQRDDDCWATTSAGQVLSDAIRRCERTEAVIEDDAAYWESHDASRIPERFRAEFHAFEGYEVVRSPDTDPYRASRLVADELAAAGPLSVVAPVYHDRYADSMNRSTQSDRRLVVTPDVVQRLVEDTPDDPEGANHVDSRVYAAGFAMAVSDDALLLSLPKLDGSYDPHTEVVAETDAAVDWGKRLFEWVWERAADTERYLADRYGEAVLDE